MHSTPLPLAIKTRRYRTVAATPPEDYGTAAQSPTPREPTAGGTAAVRTVRHVVSFWGFAAYLLLYGSVISGAALSTPSVRGRWPALASRGVHEALALAGLVTGLLHGLAYAAPVSGRAATWLFLGPRGGGGIGLPLAMGVAALYAAGLVAASFYARRRVGSPLWRWLHALSYPALAAAAWHGMAMGADAWLAPVRLMYGVTLASAGVLVVRRLAELRRPGGGRRTTGAGATARPPATEAASQAASGAPNTEPRAGG
jgi:DMSO/TMAO reductase YedYZ heme-binding membrane subunit